MGLGFRVWGLGVYGDLIMIYPEPYSNYLRMGGYKRVGVQADCVYLARLSRSHWPMASRCHGSGFRGVGL